MKPSTSLKTAFALCCLLLISLSTDIKAQINAITESGDAVILYEDKTWAYIDQMEEEVADVISIREETFVKADHLSFQVKSANTNIGVWMDPKEWTFKKAENNPAAEFEFQNKSGELYGMLIAEVFEMPVENLVDVALEQAKSVAPDLRLINKEYRIVNGNKVIHMEMHGTIQGIKFAYYGYYYSNAGGSYQLICYTSQSSLKKNIEKADQFLNGLVELD